MSKADTRTPLSLVFEKSSVVMVSTGLSTAFILAVNCKNQTRGISMKRVLAQLGRKSVVRCRAHGVAQKRG
ncbi:MULTISPECIES: hypothetical protein [Pseudomonadota]|uniref:hypothetical protein n=1 Tax=Pseudomonadota TaxID=1224 RepID=UPI001CF263EA|nr:MULTISPECIES: hypothetical protein [Pseudomonadota]MCA8081947.1 hypothetical protein [Burkholderia cepacia]MCE0755500.1 hypothetical protein [Pseudomonas asiatica]MCO2541453.1 hypothetical protein [Pseudomonas aeruginosa]MDN7664107.1 hypothetical protein [Burkholderia cenocepacia]HCF5761874.1 hypothetical protein [Pseudomonas aeruginosa]